MSRICDWDQNSLVIIIPKSHPKTRSVAIIKGWSQFLNYLIPGNNENFPNANHVKKEKQFEPQQSQIQIFNKLDIIDNESILRLEKRNQLEIDKINTQHRFIISNLERTNSAEIKHLLNKQNKEIIHLQRSRQHLENLVKMGRVRLDHSITKQVSDWRKIKRLQISENNKSAVMRELRKNQIPLLQQIRLEQFNTLEKHRRNTLFGVLPKDFDEVAIYDLKIRHEYIIQGIRIRQEDTILELRIKQVDNIHKLVNKIFY